MRDKSQLRIVGIAAVLITTLLACYFLIRFGFNLLLFFGFIVPVWLSVVILAATVLGKKIDGMTVHAKKRFRSAIIAAVVLLLGLIGYLIWYYGKTEQMGNDKFMRAWVEFEEENPGKHICAGGLLQAHSYSELSSKSIAEIKDLMASSSDTC